MSIDDMVAAKKKQWFWARAETRSFFLFAARTDGVLSLRAWADPSGAFVSVLRGKEAEEMLALLKNNLGHGSRELVIKSSPNVARDCKVRLPKHVVDELRSQVLELSQAVPRHLPSPADGLRYEIYDTWRPDAPKEPTNAAA